MLGFDTFFVVKQQLFESDQNVCECRVRVAIDAMCL